MDDPLHGVDAIDWSSYDQPAWNDADAIPSRLRALARGPDDRSITYQRVLHALGNNHAGTYFPVTLPVMPFLGVILRGPTLAARLGTLDLLIDLLGSFEPDPGYREIDTPSGPQPLPSLLHAAAARLSDDVEHLQRTSADPDEQRLAGELLALLREGT